MADLNAHEAGNGGQSQRMPKMLRGLLYSAMINAGAKPPCFLGRPPLMGQYERIEFHQTCRGNGDGKYAKLTSSNTGSPSGDRPAINWHLVRVRPGRMG